MKKVLSVLLAAAMVMGMSVTALADKSWGAKTDNTNDVDVSTLSFSNIMNVVHADGEVEFVPAGADYENMQPGDELYFKIVVPGTKEVTNLICETEEHVHEDACYELDVKDETPDCGEHVHEIGVCATEPNCDIAEHDHAAEGCIEVYKLEAHTHTEKPTTEPAKVTVTEGCYTWTWARKGWYWKLSCGKDEHVHDPATCETVWTCGEVEHIHDASCGERYACGFPGHIHTEDCYNADVKDETADCGKEAHTHADACYETKTVATADPYTNSIDKDWSINIKGNEYVADATFYTCKKGNTIPWDDAKKFTAADDEVKMIKVELVDDLDELESQNVKFKMYIADHASRNKISDKVTLSYSFANGTENTVDFDFTNDVDGASRWEATKKGTAVFDFNDKAYFTVNMIKDEEVLFNLSTAYDKYIDKAYNEYDADLSFLNFKGSKDSFTKKGELFIPSAKDNKFIYEVVDGELVEVEAKYNDSYKVGGVGNRKGYVIETNELGYYVIADEELVIVKEEAKVETSTAPEKANPETGAESYVGAAVAMAVVSVAAAGALAFKK